MKNALPFKLFAILLFMQFHTLFAKDIYKNNFSTDIGKGYWGTSSDISGVNWTLDVSNCTLTNSSDYVKVVSTNSGRLEAVDCDGEAVWRSPIIDISNFLDCDIYLKVGETGSSTSNLKYVKVYYKVDNGEEIPFENHSSNIGNWGTTNPSQSNITGNNLQIIVRMNNPLASNKVYIDNILVEGELPDLGSTIIFSNWTSEELELSSLFTTKNSAKELFHFIVEDYAADNFSTTINQMYFEAGDANTIDWEDSVQDFIIKLGDEILSSVSQIDDDHVKMIFSEKELQRIVANNEQKEFALFAYFKEGKVIDHKIFQIKIPQNSNNWICDNSGSTFRNKFDTDVVSQQFTSEVVASKIIFKEIPKYVSIDSVFSVQTQYVDRYENIDFDKIQTMQIDLAAGTGTLKSATSLEKNAENGICIWNDLTYDKAENFTLQVRANQFPTIVSENISSVDQSSLIFAGETINNSQLSGLSTDSLSAIPVLNFRIRDDAKHDQLPTIITTMKFYKEEIEKAFDWQKHIAGALLYQNENIVAQTHDINSNYIRFYNSKGILRIDNGTEQNFQLRIYFRKGGLSDHKTLKVKIPKEDFAWKTHVNSSQIKKSLESEIYSPKMMISIVSDRLLFSKHPFFITDSTQYFHLEISAVDAFRNIDLDSNESFQILVEEGKGNLIYGKNELQLSAGIASLDSIKYKGSDDFKLQINKDTCFVFVGKDNVNQMFNFEDQKKYFFENNKDWDISSYQPILGKYSLKHNLSEQTGSSYIRLKLNNYDPKSASTEWNFILKNGNWNPSSSNRFCYYLLSDHQDPKQANCAIAVGVNYVSSKNQLSLFKVKENKISELIPSQFYWNENETVAIKVILDARGKWTFYYNRLGQERNYTKAGEISEEIIPDKSNWYSTLQFDFGTASRAGELWFDQLKIHSINTAPYLKNYKLENRNQIRMFFSEAVRLQDVTIFTLQKEISVITDFEIFIENKNEIILRLKDNFKTGNYTLKLKNIGDLQGKILKYKEIKFQYITPAQEHDIVINEILVDESPSIHLPEYEFIELYNCKAEPIVLTNCKLQIGDKESLLFADTLDANSYLILCSKSAVDSYSKYGKTMGISNFPSLSNESATIRLISAENQIIDTICYHSCWYKNSQKSKGGWSLERIDPLNISWQEPNWSVCADKCGGTPGKVNSIKAINKDEISPNLTCLSVISDTTICLSFSEPLCLRHALLPENYRLGKGEERAKKADKNDQEGKEFLIQFLTPMNENQQYELHVSNLQDLAGNLLQKGIYHFWNPSLCLSKDIIINEVLFNPHSNGSDYVEIYNRSNKVLDLSKLSLATRDSNYKIEQAVALANQQIYIQPNTYCVFSPDTASLKNIYYTSNSNTFRELDKMPSYPDSEGRIVLLQSEHIIDDFAYDEKMHFDLLSSKEGVALERINPNHETNDKNNWQSAAQNIGFGTPGLKNSAYSNKEIVDRSVSLSSKHFSPDNDGVDDRLYVNFNLEESGYLVNIRIYDSVGNEIRKLATNVSLGTNDQLYWDGLDANGKQLDIGIYLIYIELFNLKGKVKEYKKPCILSLRFK